jgi:hypothetical protein
MKIKKLRITMLLSVVSCAALLNGCGSSSKEGTTNGATNGGVSLVDEGTCIVCHSTTTDPVSSTSIVGDYAKSIHNPANTPADTTVNAGNADGCQGCHGGGAEHNGIGPIPFPDPLASSRCIVCHTTAKAALFTTQLPNEDFAGNCSDCHTGTTATSGNLTGIGIHGANLPFRHDCVGCHSFARDAPPHRSDQIVSDNSGVRSVVQEFSKWSHHVTGVTLNNAHCAACHLEGTVKNGAIVTDPTKHMADNMVHLRNVKDDTDMQWNPEIPNFTTMDNFCMGCHSATGATSLMSVQIQSLFNNSSSATNPYSTGKTASATNPFGDTISNQYDLMQRPAVVDVASQFNTANPSHHAVMGQRYSGRTRVAGARAINNTGALLFTRNSSATLPGPRTTIYDAGKFEPTYRTLSAAPGTSDKTLGDDSVLHCADCHTVGQFAARGSVAFGNLSTAFGGGITNFYKTAIGAHGSNNEYMLRNSIGSDQRHQGIQLDSAGIYHPDKVTPYLVCFNCHATAIYGTAGHAGEQDNSPGEGNCDVATNTNSVNLIGQARLQDIYTMTSGTGVFGTPTGVANGNIFGIQCNNCHNSGISAGNIFGGIHGAKDPTYTDGAGNTTKHERFLPGLGNVMYVPGTQGGITGGHVSAPVTSIYGPTGATGSFSYTFQTGGTTNDANWEENQKVRVVNIKGSGAHAHQAGPAGCYTISDGTDDNLTNPPADGSGDPEGTGITSSLVPASKGLTAPNGQLLYGNWGGCAEHAQAPGTTPRAPRSGETSIRPVTY